MCKKELRRFRPCGLCETTQAVDGSALCRACLDDVERDNTVDNFEACVVCGSELRRGHCYQCTDQWSAAQVMAR